MEISNINQTFNEDDELIVSAKLDGIQFNNITHEDDGVKVQTPIVRRNNNWEAGTTTNWKASVNAVDIDWNGARPDIGEGENGITTTGDLLSSIKGVYSPMFAN